MEESGQYHVAHYWDIYFNMRLATERDDARIREIIRSIRNLLKTNAVSPREAVRLRKLSRMIRAELRAAKETAQSDSQVA